MSQVKEQHKEQTMTEPNAFTEQERARDQRVEDTLVTDDLVQPEYTDVTPAAEAAAAQGEVVLSPAPETEADSVSVPVEGTAQDEPDDVPDEEVPVEVDEGEDETEPMPADGENHVGDEDKKGDELAGEEVDDWLDADDNDEYEDEEEVA